MTEGRFPTYRFLGIQAQPLTKADLLGAIESTVASEAENCIIGNHNLHSVYLVQRDEEMRACYDRNLYTHIDGMSLIFLAKMMNIPLRAEHRNGYMDWFEDFLRTAERNSWRLYFLGGPPEMAAKFPLHFQKEFPKLNYRSHHGFDAFSPNTTVFEEIQEFAPHVIVVGMGMPLQERWILDARERIHTHLFLPCGATLEYLLGIQKPAPRWLGTIGLEWLYRLISQPRRLYRRYLIEPVLLIPMILREIASGKSPLEE